MQIPTNIWWEHVLMRCQFCIILLHFFLALDVSKCSRMLMGALPNMIKIYLSSISKEFYLMGSIFDLACLLLKLNFLQDTNNWSKCKINYANYFLLPKMVSLCNLKLTSLAGNPSMPKWTLEFTASSFIDRNYKTNISLLIRSIEQ